MDQRLRGRRQTRDDVVEELLPCVQRGVQPELESAVLSAVVSTRDEDEGGGYPLKATACGKSTYPTTPGKRPSFHGIGWMKNKNEVEAC